METKDIPTPMIIKTDPDGLGIHLGYIVRDLAEIKKTQKENWESMTKGMNDLKGVYITRDEFAPYKQEMGELKKFMEEKMITKDEFEPIKKLAYGAVGLVLTAIGLTIIALVLKH